MLAPELGKEDLHCWPDVRDERSMLLNGRVGHRYTSPPGGAGDAGVYNTGACDARANDAREHDVRAYLLRDVR